MTHRGEGSTGDQYNCALLQVKNLINDLKSKRKEQDGEECLQVEHLQLLSKTPFAYLVKAMDNDTILIQKKPITLLDSVLATYDKKKDAFKFGNKFYKPSATDVQLIFGLQEGDEEVGNMNKFTKKESSIAMRLFGDLERLKIPDARDMAIQLVCDKDKESIEDTVRLICLVLLRSVFYTNSGTFIPWGFCHYVDNLDEMCKYNWSKDILKNLHNYLKKGWRRRKSLNGCTLLLLYWLCEHTSLIPNRFTIDDEQPKNNDKFCAEGVPRATKWDLLQLSRVVNADVLRKLDEKTFMEGELEIMVKEMMLRPPVKQKTKKDVILDDHPDFVEMVIEHGGQYMAVEITNVEPAVPTVTKPEKRIISRSWKNDQLKKKRKGSQIRKKTEVKEPAEIEGSKTEDDETYMSEGQMDIVSVELSEDDDVVITGVKNVEPINKTVRRRITRSRTKWFQNEDPAEQGDVTKESADASDVGGDTLNVGEDGKINNIKEIDDLEEGTDKRTETKDASDVGGDTSVVGDDGKKSNSNEVGDLEIEEACNIEVDDIETRVDVEIHNVGEGDKNGREEVEELPDEQQSRNLNRQSDIPTFYLSTPTQPTQDNQYYQMENDKEKDNEATKEVEDVGKKEEEQPLKDPDNEEVEDVGNEKEEPLLKDLDNEDVKMSKAGDWINAPTIAEKDGEIQELKKQILSNEEMYNTMVDEKTKLFQTVQILEEQKSRLISVLRDNVVITTENDSLKMDLFNVNTELEVEKLKNKKNDSKIKEVEENMKKQTDKLMKLNEYMKLKDDDRLRMNRVVMQMTEKVKILEAEVIEKARIVGDLTKKGVEDTDHIKMLNETVSLKDKMLQAQEEKIIELEEKLRYELNKAAFHETVHCVTQTSKETTLGL